MKANKKLSRSTRWHEACSVANVALSTLNDLKTEYEEWRDNLPENLQSSTLGEKLEAVCDLDIDSVLDMIEEAENLELPLGFGRD
jgi:hypothetical protein